MEKHSLKNSSLINALLLAISLASLISIATDIWNKSLIIGIIAIFLVLVVCIIKKDRISQLTFSVDGYFCAAIVLSIGIVIEHFESSVPVGDFYGLNLNSNGVLLTSSIIKTLLSIPAIIFLSKWIIESVLKINKEKFIKIFSYKTPFLILSGIYTVGILAIIRANYNYIDDMGRVAVGYKSWLNFSRFLSNFLSNYLHANSYLTDVSPLPQLIAAVILAISSVIVLYAFTGKNKFSFWEYCAVVPLGLSPYFLECLSYKYDSPYMALSIFFAVVPVLFISNNKNWKPLAFSSFIGTIGMCMSYQVSSGILPMFIIFLLLTYWLRKSWDFAKCKYVFLSSAGGYIAGILVFKFVIMRPADTYTTNLTPSIKEFFPNLILNYKNYFNNLIHDFNPVWSVLVILVIISSLVVAFKFSKQKRALAIAVTFITELFTIMLAFGLYPALISPIYHPRAMYGIGVWIAFVAISIVIFIDSVNKLLLPKLFVFSLSWAFFAFSFTYGNALYAQKTYTEYRVTEIAQDINDLFTDDVTRELQIKGKMSFSPVVSDSMSHFPILERLVPCTLREEWSWGNYDICRYYDLNIKAHKVEDIIDDFDMPVLAERKHYIIKGDEDYIIVELTDK